MSGSSSRKINWCKQQPKGIRFQEPNNSIAQAYLDNARETINLIKGEKENTPRLWQATHNYYALYFCAYALLMNCGIKSEIHDCTIALIEELESKSMLPTNLSEHLASAKQQRIDNQYYLKNQPVTMDEKVLTALFLKTKKATEEMTTQDILRIREHLNTPSHYQNQNNNQDHRTSQQDNKH